MQGWFGKRAFGVTPDALDHGHQTVRSLRCQMFIEVQAAKRFVSIDSQNFLGSSSRIEREEDGD